MSKYAVSYFNSTMDELVWLERPDMTSAEECALAQAEDETRGQITIWVAVQRIVPKLEPIQ